MEPLQTLKALIARLAGAPLATRPGEGTARGIARGIARASDTPHGCADGPGRGRGSPHAQTAVAPTPTRAGGVRVARAPTARRRHGDEGEEYARRYLECAGLVYVAAQVRYRDGELDLVMRDSRHAARHGSTLVFVEVRRRARGSHGGALESITREKRRRVVAAAAHYLVGLGQRALPNCRFDVVTLTGDRPEDFHIEWIRNAFRDDG